MTEPNAAQAWGLTRGFCELTLEARDPETLARFYRETFGWEELSRQQGRIWLGCGAGNGDPLRECRLPEREPLVARDSHPRDLS